MKEVTAGPLSPMSSGAGSGWAVLSWKLWQCCRSEQQTVAVKEGGGTRCQGDRSEPGFNSSPLWGVWLARKGRILCLNTYSDAVSHPREQMLSPCSNPSAAWHCCFLHRPFFLKHILFIYISLCSRIWLLHAFSLWVDVLPPD